MMRAFIMLLRRARCAERPLRLRCFLYLMPYAILRARGRDILCRAPPLAESDARRVYAKDALMRSFVCLFADIAILRAFLSPMLC